VKKAEFGTAGRIFPEQSPKPMTYPFPLATAVKLSSSPSSRNFL